MFSKKSTNNFEIFTVDLTFTCEDFVFFMAFLENMNFKKNLILREGNLFVKKVPTTANSALDQILFLIILDFKKEQNTFHRKKQNFDFYNQMNHYV